MTENKWIIVLLLLSVYYCIIVLTINTRGKNILFGKVIISSDGLRLIPVFYPISWFIHDINSAKLIGQKVGPNEMMTSDMTPDENGNYGRHPIGDDYIGNRIRYNIKEINNRDSKVADNSNFNNAVDRHKTSGKQTVYYHKEADNLFNIDRNLKISQESNKEKRIARKKFSEQILLNKEPEWPSGTDEPIFTSIEIYDIPGINKYMGLASNRTVIHKSPETQITNNYTKSYINIKSIKV